MIHFLLAPDKASSLALKRRVAENGARMDVMVGTWPELLTKAREAHILHIPQDVWQEKLISAARGMKNAFWSASLNNVPAEEESIISIVGQHLTLLLEGLGPDKNLGFLADKQVQGRLQSRLRDFSELHACMEHVLPPELGVVKGIISASPERQLRPIRVYHLDDWPRLNPWQKCLVATLNFRSGVADPSLAGLLGDAPFTPSAADGSLLHHIQSNLFSPSVERKSCDTSMQWIGCRDCLQEAEVVAGMVQRAMSADISLSFSDFALLLPRDERYLQAVADCFTHAGIPLSVLENEVAVRDLGREVVYYFLLCTRGLAPSMALATLLTSPLMPWDAVIGNRLAHKVMEGDFNLKLPADADSGYQIMVALIRKHISSPSDLSDVLGKFVKLLRVFPYGDHPLQLHRKRAEESVKKLNGMLGVIHGALTDAGWDDLLRLCQPQPFGLAASRDGVTWQGIAVFQEGDEPWRRVRRLFVLGCSEGHYPADATRSPVFFDADLEALRDECGLLVETLGGRSRHLRGVFRRQLCAAADEVTLLAPRRDRMGKALSLSPALAFMASYIEGKEDGEKLILDLDVDLNDIRGLALADERDADEPWKPLSEDLDLGTDLMALKEGAESPSRLEVLMISPLAWLLNRMQIKAQDWQPEQMDVAAKGRLAHRVFELFFARGTPLPSNDEVASRVPGLLQVAVTELYPYLNRPEWNVECEHLAQDIINAAQRWNEVLAELGATVLGNEIRLKGSLKIGENDTLSVHGDADLLLELPGDRLFVVDYKKSSSRDRRKRMKAGYDHQATLYGTMIRTGGPEYPDKVSPEVIERLKYYRENGEIRALYYLMNDQQILSDSKGWMPDNFLGQPEMGDGISCEALTLIEKRVGQVRFGKVELNRDLNNEEFNNNLGMSAKYVFETSQLIKLCIKKNYSDK